MLLLWAGRSSAILEPVIASSFGQSVLFEWIKQIGQSHNGQSFVINKLCFVFLFANLAA